MRRLSRLVPVVGLVMAVLAGIPSAVHAQEAPQRQQLENRVRQAFQNRIRQELQLTRDEVPRLAEVIQWSEGQRRDIAARTRTLNQQSIDYLRNGGTEGDAQAILDERRALQRAEADLFAEEQERLLSVLTPNQVVRYYRLRDQFNRQLQQARARRSGTPGS